MGLRKPRKKNFDEIVNEAPLQERTKNEEVKLIQIPLPKSLWGKLKMLSVKREIEENRKVSLRELIIELLEKAVEREEI